GLDGNPMPYILSRRVIATGEEMVNAQSTYDQNGLPAVSVTLNATAGKRMFDFTSMNVGRPMAVVYIERVPQVRMVDGEEVRTFRDSEESSTSPTSRASSAVSSRPPGWRSRRPTTWRACCARA